MKYLILTILIIFINTITLYADITNYDCGDMSNVVLSSNSYSGLVTINSDGVDGEVMFSSGMDPLSFLCSGSMSVDAPIGSVYVFLSSVSLQGVWTDNFLMGLAGIVCGSLMAYVFIKYAV